MRNKNTMNTSFGARLAVIVLNIKRKTRKQKKKKKDKIVTLRLIIKGKSEYKKMK